NAVGSSGTLAHPSAPAVRQTTDTDRWSWDYHLDYLNATQSKDYTNSGLTGGTTGGAQIGTFGASVRVANWGGAITASAQTAPLGDQPVTLPNGMMADLDATTLRARVAAAHWFPTRDVAVGLALQIASLD